MNNDTAVVWVVIFQGGDMVQDPLLPHLFLTAVDQIFPYFSTMFLTCFHQFAQEAEKDIGLGFAPSALYNSEVFF